jgi:hypothetical protein
MGVVTYEWQLGLGVESRRKMAAMRVLLALSVVLVAGVTMAISCAGSSVPTVAPTVSPTPVIPQQPNTRTPQPPPTLNPRPDFNATPFPETGGTGLTLDEQSEIGRIVHADPEVAEIAGGTAYDLREYGAWLGDDDPITGQATLIGGFVTIAFLQPIPHVEHDFRTRQARPYFSAWPDDAKAKYGPYAEGTEHRSIDNLRRLYAFVDLQKQEVAFFRVMDEFGQTVRSGLDIQPTPLVTVGPSHDANEIFDNDDRLARLLHGRDYNDPRPYIIQYTIAGKHLAAVNVGFEQPQVIEGDWLIAVDANYETWEFTTAVIHFKAPDVSLIQVTIDLDKKEVVSVQPSARHGD